MRLSPLSAVSSLSKTAVNCVLLQLRLLVGGPTINPLLVEARKNKAEIIAVGLIFIVVLSYRYSTVRCNNIIM